MSNKKDIQNKCLHHLVLDIFGYDSEFGKKQREEVSKLIDRGEITPTIDWKIKEQDVLAELIFNDKDLLSAIRNEYLTLCENYLEFERRLKEYQIKRWESEAGSEASVIPQYIRDYFDKPEGERK